MTRYCLMASTVAITLVLTVSRRVEAQQIAAGRSSTCTTNIDGWLWCWGDNTYGELGIGTFGGQSAVPLGVPFSQTNHMDRISVGYHEACGIVSSSPTVPAGTLYCWGLNIYGELGNNTTTNSNVPVQVQGIGSVTAISVGGGHACAISEGAVFCWGDNSHGQLGIGQYCGTPCSHAMRVLGDLTGQTVISVAAGDQHTCAVTSTGALYCWGSNVFGQVGTGDPQIAYYLSPVLIPGPSVPPNRWTDASAGLKHTCAVFVGGVYCWGDNSFGQLGIGNFTNNISNWSPSNQTIPAISSGAISIATGNEAVHSCALTDDSAMHCWGRNFYGTVGDNTDSDRASAVIPVYMGVGVTQISVGANETCAWAFWGLHPYCWGYGLNGQLGDNDFTTNRWFATEVYGW